MEEVGEEVREQMDYNQLVQFHHCIKIARHHQAAREGTGLEVAEVEWLQDQEPQTVWMVNRVEVVTAAAVVVALAPVF